MTDPLDTITNALHATGKTVKRSGNRIMAQCPAHPDRTPSLAITRGDNSSRTTSDVVLWPHK